MKTKLLIIMVFIGTCALAQTVRTVTYDFDDAVELTAGTLRYEILHANEGDSIIFAPSINKITLEQDIVISKNVSINARGLIIQVETPTGSNYRIFNIGEGGNTTLLLDNAVLRGGNLTGNTNDVRDLENCGGAILVNQNAKLILKNSSISNSLGNYAGAIYAAEKTEMTLSNCYFYGNEATTNNAGVVYNLGLLTTEGCLFENNASALDGAALTSNNAHTTIRNCVFVGNQASKSTSANNGGAYFNTGTNAKTLALVENCTFYNNVGVNKGSGAYTSSGGAKAVFTNCTFHNNSNNDATGAGAIYLRNSSATLINCTVSGNQSVAAGTGGLTLAAGTATYLNLVLINTIVTHNYNAGNTSDINIGAGNVVGGYNVVGTITGNSSLTNEIAFAYSPESNLFANYSTANGVRIPELKDNGGILCRGEIIKTIALLDQSGASSIAFNGGTGSYETYSIPATDQRGFSRDTQSPCIGAFEVGGASRLYNSVMSNIAVFPNPAKDYIRFQVEGTISRIELFSLSGKLLYSQNQNVNTLSLGNLSSGTYFLKVYTDNVVYSGKFLVE